MDSNHTRHNMLRGLALLALSARLVGGHPLCWTNDRPPDTDKTEFLFCPNEQFSGDAFLQYGSCCTDLEEGSIEAMFTETSELAPAGELTAECADLYKQLMCIQCHSFSNHLFERLGPEFGLLDGMNLKQDFCEALVSACGNQIDFGGPEEYDGLSYCEQHAGLDGDEFWSYPYTDPPILEPGLNLVFPNIAAEDIPPKLDTVRLTPDASEFWIGGREGQVSRIPAIDRETEEISVVVDISTTGIFYLDIETGLIDLAFDPKFSDNNFFYLSHTVNLGTSSVEQHNRLSRFIDIPGDPAATLETELVLLTSGQKNTRAHSSGWLGFKPSAYRSPDDFNDLYWNSGDGGPQQDTIGASQDTQNLLGSMMRISVPTTSGYVSSAGQPYDIPSGNYQERDSSAAPEVCAIGFRNPWRCSFDRLDDTLWCGDVGQSSVETIKIVECGNNYGWSLFEGSYCFPPNQGRVWNGVENPQCSEDMDRSAIEFPVYEYCHPSHQSNDPVYSGGKDYCGDREIVGNAVIGGYVYRGSYFADLLYGAYIFADYENRNIYFLEQNDSGMWVSGTIVSDRTARVISMTEDENGEILLVTSEQDIFYLPCGDLCSSTCLEQAEEQPTIEQVGCFADSATNPALALDSPALCGAGQRFMSPQVCASYCATVPNAVYAGVEDGTDCYCGAAGEVYDKNGALGDESCGTLCLSNPGSTCGGLGAIEIYTIGTPVEPSPATNTPSPTALGLPSGHDEAEGIIYAGCFQDGKTRGGPPRIFPEGGLRSGQNNAQFCKVHCAKYDFYGTQYGRECWCGNGTPEETYELYGQLDDSDCGMPCTGDATEGCGGPNIMSVYVTQNKLLGCYRDGAPVRVGTPRVFSKVERSDTQMTAQYCKGICEGFDYYGTQYSRECWCGSGTPEETYELYGQLDDSECAMPCTGDPTEVCGGPSALTVYTF